METLPLFVGGDPDGGRNIQEIEYLKVNKKLRKTIYIYILCHHADVTFVVNYRD